MSKRWPNKVIVGLTGNIATGKSTVLAMAAARGAQTIDADKIVHEILDEDPQIQEAVVSEFGKGMRLSDGRIDRPTLGTIVFDDTEALSRLENIVHPAVHHLLIARIGRSFSDIVFVEAIKLLEGRLVDFCDEVWVTRCSREQQIERLVKERRMDPEMAAARVRAQFPQELKVAAADVVIDTGGSIEDTERFFELAWSRLQKRLPRPELAQETQVVPERDTRREAPDARSGMPQRLTERGAKRLKKRLRPVPPSFERTEAKEVKPAIEQQAAPRVLVRRAKPYDIPAILLMMHRTSKGQRIMNRAELLKAMGERGYLIAQIGMEIGGVAGWSSENRVATVEQLFIHTDERTGQMGKALLDEIEETARALICEVILALLPEDADQPIQSLYLANGFSYVNPRRLPRVWNTVVDQRRPDGKHILLKKLATSREIPADAFLAEP